MRTRFIARCERVEATGEVVLHLVADPEWLGRAAMLLRLYARRKPFTLRLVRNDAGGAVMRARPLRWTVNGDGVRLQVTVDGGVSGDRLLALAGQAVVVDAYDDEEGGDD